MSVLANFFIQHWQALAWIGFCTGVGFVFYRVRRDAEIEQQEAVQASAVRVHRMMRLHQRTEEKRQRDAMAYQGKEQP